MIHHVGIGHEGGHEGGHTGALDSEGKIARRDYRTSPYKFLQGAQTRDFRGCLAGQLIILSNAVSVMGYFS